MGDSVEDRNSVGRAQRIQNIHAVRSLGVIAFLPELNEKRSKTTGVSRTVSSISEKSRVVKEEKQDIGNSEKPVATNIS